jgi:hypothetical protein
VGAVRYPGTARWALAFALVTAVAGCGPHQVTPSPSPLSLSWRPVGLPSAGPGDPVVRDVAVCDGRWYAVGGSVTPDGTATPAIWSSPDGTTWSALPTRPVSLYGRMSVLSAVACHADTVVAMGAAAGGAHGNPRTATWVGTPASGIAENATPFELFGGDAAVGVGPLTAGPRGWLIGGGWVDQDSHPGAAVWWSADGASFARVDGDPALESGASGSRVLQAVLGVPDGFLASGSYAPGGGARRQPQVWRSPDGTHWASDPVPVPDADAEIQALTSTPTGLLAAGVDGTAFGAWQDEDAGWRFTGAFGKLGGTALPRVTGLVVVAGRDLLVAADGTRFGLWAGRDGQHWAGAALPVLVEAGAGHSVRLAASGSTVLLAIQDAGPARLWLATV